MSEIRVGTRPAQYFDIGGIDTDMEDADDDLQAEIAQLPLINVKRQNCKM